VRFILIDGPNEYWRATAAVDGLASESLFVLLIGEATTTVRRDNAERLLTSGDPLPSALREHIALSNLSVTKIKNYRGPINPVLAE
jgi:hypothetical protein